MKLIHKLKKRNTMNKLKLYLLFIGSLFILSFYKVELKETVIDLTTYKLTTYSSINNNKYLIVFESGLGDDHSPWIAKNIIKKISGVSDVVIYDRAGIGKSESGPNPRNIERLSAELDSVINKFINGRKVILVGHSLGGLIIRDYAIKNPEKTGALLFVDPTHELYNHLSQSNEDTISNLLERIYGSDFGGVKEANQLIEDLQYSSTLPNLPDVPVVVLTSMKQNADNIAADKINESSRQGHYDAQETLKTGVTDFTQVGTTRSGHYIMYDEPSLIIDNLKLLISKLD